MLPRRAETRALGSEDRRMQGYEWPSPRTTPAGAVSVGRLKGSLRLRD
jgi:hypothetical protein